MEITRWTLEYALIFFRSVEPSFRRHGWLLSMYGSVVGRGEGRDLDLIAVPWRHKADHLAVISMLRSDFGGLIEDDREGLMGTNSYALQLSDGRVLDIQFRLQQEYCSLCRGAMFG